MKKNLFLSITSLLIIGIMSLSSCQKDEDNNEPVPPPPTAIELTILNSIGNIVVDASVTLYDSETNYNNQTSPVASKITDANGKASFSNLKGIKYYWTVEKDCDDNSNGAITTAQPLTENVTTKLNVIILPKTNTIHISSWEDEDYYYYVNGSYIGIISAYGDKYLDDLSNGTYNFEFKEVDYIFSQTTYTGSVNVNCGEEKTISFGNKK